MINIPIVFTIDYKFLPPAYIAIYSLIKNADDTTKYDIHVLYNGVIDKKVNLLKRNIKGTRHNMVIHDVSKLQIFVPKTTKCWPNIVYIRLYLPQILKQYDKVIYSDVDVLFLGDLADAYNTEINGYMWAGVAAEKNSPYVLMHQYYNENHHEYIYWSGFMVMNLDEMRKNNWIEICNKNLLKYSNRLYMFDLEIMNLSAEKIKRLPFRYVCLQAIYDSCDIKCTQEYMWLSKVYSYKELEYEKKKAIIVHYAGKVGRIGKVWLKINPPQYYAFYMKQLPLELKLQNNVQRINKNMRARATLLLDNFNIKHN